MTTAPATLTSLRAEIDALDDRLHDMLMARAAIIERVAGTAGKTGTKIRPGREAAMLRRRLTRHQGSLPPQTILRIWRELFAGALVIEGGQTIAVCGAEDGVDLSALAREHFGPLTPLRRHPNPAQALADLEHEAAQIAVLPPPSEEADGAWWTTLGTGQRNLSVIAKLPFWRRRPEGVPLGEAYAVAAMRPDASGADRGLLTLELAADTSRAKLSSLLTAAGFEPGTIWLKRVAGEAAIRALVEVDGLIEDTDPRLASIGGLAAPAMVIGGFAVPFGEP